MPRFALAVTLALLTTTSACKSGSTATPMPVDAGTADAFVEPPPEVVIEGLGTVIGQQGDGYRAFLGIPYAKPPIGELRWRSPEPIAPWDAPIDARTPGDACPQEALGLTASGQEDCLLLNVHTPDPAPPAGAPVLVWIHGGAFVFGEGLQADGGTAGDLLAQRYGLVVVSMNYRLGAFGFVTSAALGADGNQGFEDQQLALRWVRDHIADFGGDPARVTIAGESAGGLSVCLHLVAPGSAGLFARAISESGLCDSVLPSRAEMEASNSALVTAAGCASATTASACMRAKTTAEIRAAAALEGDALDLLLSGETQFWPSIDGEILPGGFRERVTAGDVASVPVVLGWNRDEGTLFVALAELQGAVVDETAYHTAIASFAGGAGLDAATVEAQYPLASYPDPGAALAAAIGHASLACPSRRAAALLASAGANVHVYRFDFPDAAFQLTVSRMLGAFHSAEIQYVFGHPSRLGQEAFRDDHVPLYETMSAYWARFVETGDPNGAGAPMWPAYALDTDAHLVLDRTVAQATGADRDVCVLWDGAR